MNEMLTAFLRGVKQGARAYFAPFVWTAHALRRAATDAFGQTPPKDGFKLSSH